MNNLKNQFLLDPTVTFLNHGSFGACPKPVFETYQRWQLELERQPVEFLGRRFDDLMDQARARLADYLHAPTDSLIFVPNATAGVNTFARSLNLQPGDEILTTDHEYGACDLTWQFVCRQTGAVYRHYPIPLPVTTHADFVESFWSAVTPRTRVIFISHITSPTALIFPVAEICRRAREAGILTIVDGAHAPGQIPLDLEAIGADAYTGNCHKWLCAPKGAAFLYVRSELHTHIDPLVVSWGDMNETLTFVNRNQWQGTREPSAFLSVPAAIDFEQVHQWDEVRLRCHQMASEMRGRLAELFDLPPICPDSPEWFAQMITAPLPPCDPAVLKTRLYDEFRVEVPIVTWQDKHYIRVSFQGYNTPADAEALFNALQKILC
ncbi:MAG: aminotransferase class V-fold PLP-dependent enzyme [Chloroflexi bacterium]|nr:aminotransferase class V-fold PLP-dependent enzyme [Chloroflexota bacterium]